MKQKLSNSSNYPLILVLAGIITYIAVDAGIFQWAKSKINRPTTSAESNVKTTQESLQEYSRKLSGELSGVEKEIGNEKKKLQTLRDQVAQYEQNMAKQKRDLSQLDKEIKTLSNLKQALNSAQDHVARQENKKARLEGEVRKLASAPPIWTMAPASLEEIAEAIQKSTHLEALVEPIKYGVQEFVRLKANIGYGKDSIFLTQRGIQQTSIFAEGVAAMGYPSVQLVHHVEDSLVLDRAGVIKRYLTDRYGDKISVSTVQVDDDVDLTDGLEVWATKETKE